MNSWIRNRISGNGGARDVLRIALPLILSTSAYTLQLFIDRMFLMWYKSSAMSASMYSGILSYTIFALFLGTAGYVNTFVAQYDGSGHKKRVGAAMWQGIYFSVVTGAGLTCLAGFAPAVVSFAQHAPDVQYQEGVFLRILLIGSVPTFLTAALACFFTGRGKTWTVLWVDCLASAMTIVLDYALIFGNWGFPEMGIAGAGWATVASSTFACMIYFMLFLRPQHRQTYASLSGWRFESQLFWRLMRFGLPAGTHYMLDIVGFTLFLTFIGRIGPEELAATSMAFQINTLAFMPMTGFATAVSTLVGQYLGGDKPALAARATWSATWLTMAYMIAISAGYWFRPEAFMAPFAAEANPAEYAAIKPLVITLLGFVAFYSLFDTGNLIFSAAIKGAGDTRFVMLVSIVLSWVLLVIPSYIAVVHVSGTKGLFLAWTAATAYVCTCAVVFLLRFLTGKWKSMRVIEMPPPAVPRKLPPLPTTDFDL